MTDGAHLFSESILRIYLEPESFQGGNVYIK